MYLVWMIADASHDVISLLVYIIFFFFFFSSRRRHTRSDRDWSSDVCSSDLFRTTPAVLRGKSRSPLAGRCGSSATARESAARCAVLLRDSRRWRRCSRAAAARTADDPRRTRTTADSSSVRSSREKNALPALRAAACRWRPGPARSPAALAGALPEKGPPAVRRALRESS